MKKFPLARFARSRFENLLVFIMDKYRHFSRSFKFFSKYDQNFSRSLAVCDPSVFISGYICQFLHLGLHILQKTFKFSSKSRKFVPNFFRNSIRINYLMGLNFSYLKTSAASWGLPIPLKPRDPLHVLPEAYKMLPPEPKS